MCIALATSAEVPDLTPDDRLLQLALDRLGISAAAAVWDDSSVHWAGFRAIILRSTWDYHLRLDDFLAWIAVVEPCTVLWNPGSLVRRNARKTYLRDLIARGVPTVPTQWLDAGRVTQLDEALAGHDWEAAVVKPVVSANAWNTSLVWRGRVAAGQRVLDRYQPRHPFMLQPYRTSVETEGELSLIFTGRALVHAVRKIPVAGDFRAQEDFGARVERLNPPSEAIAVAELGLDALDESPLYARVDLLRNDAGGYEVGEVELIEPSLFLSWCPGSAGTLARAIVERLGG